MNYICSFYFNTGAISEILKESPITAPELTAAERCVRRWKLLADHKRFNPHRMQISLHLIRNVLSGGSDWHTPLVETRTRNAGKVDMKRQEKHLFDHSQKLHEILRDKKPLEFPVNACVDLQKLFNSKPSPLHSASFSTGVKNPGLICSCTSLLKMMISHPLLDFLIHLPKEFWSDSIPYVVRLFIVEIITFYHLLLCITTVNTEQTLRAEQCLMILFSSTMLTMLSP